MLDGINDRFESLAERITRWSGSPYAFALAVLAILSWFVTGLTIGFTETVQLAVNTGTTIVTFLMVFLIQAQQNKSDVALHAKLDELIHAIEGARDELIEAETQSTKKLDEYRQSLKDA